MKFAVEIDLDWVEEDSTLDEEVKQQIIKSIENKVLQTLKDSVLKSAQEKIDAQIEGMVDASVSALVSAKIAELMAISRTATDSYGRVTKENFTIEQKLIDAVEGAISTKTLDENGRPTSGYQVKYSYFDYFTLKDIPALIDKQVKTLAEQTKKDIEVLVRDKIKTEVADKLTNLIVENSTALSLRSDKK